MQSASHRALAWIGVATGLLVGACSAGNYEISDCDSATTNLTTDVCNKFNTDPNSCMPYQCDRTTSRCIQAARDWDRDGYPDSRCGGMDCDDRDPKITGGADGACSCKLAGMTCSAGQGACKRFASYNCQNNVAVCPALAAQPDDWRATPYGDAPNSYGSEDWSCDGNVERACCYVNTNGTRICQPCTQQASLCTGDVTAVCTSLCNAMNGNATACQAAAPKMVTCNTGLCGSRVAICYCTVGNFLTNPCNLQKATEDKLHCR